MRGLSNLEFLSVSMLNLSSTTFDNLPYLKRLKIDSSDFSNITNNAFKRLSNLECLFIICPRNTAHLTYAGIPNLKFLILARLDSFNLDLNGIPSLSMLSLIYCDNDTNSNEFFNSLKHSNLKTLNLKMSYFSNFNTSFLSGMPRLQTLIIEKSETDSITFSENLSNLTALILKENNIETFDSTISLLKGLKSLDLSENCFLKSSSKMFLGLDNLERLNLCKCKALGEIHMNMLSGLDSLIELDLSYCELTRIHSEAFSHTHKLTKLNLSHNHLKIENAWFLCHLTQLKELDMSNNGFKYSKIEHGLFSSLVSLEVLDLKHNGTEGIKNLKNMTKNLKKLRELIF